MERRCQASRCLGSCCSRAPVPVPISASELRARHREGGAIPGSGGAPTAGTKGPPAGRVRRVALIGLDCGTPELLFERYADDMPTLTKLREQALWGPLRTIDPPISIPAWICMLSGRTPGDLGVYGMRNRSDHSYKGLAFATSKTFKAPRLWELLGAAGHQSIVLSVPGTYPPT